MIYGTFRSAMFTHDGSRWLKRFVFSYWVEKGQAAPLHSSREDVVSELPLCCRAQEGCMWPSLSSSAIWVRMLCTLQRTLANVDAYMNIDGCELCLS